MNGKQRIAIIGATSAIAEQCARLWAQRDAVQLILIGRQRERLERVATDLRVRSPQVETEVVEADFLDPDAIRSVVERIVGDGAIDIALIAHGSLPDQPACQSDLQSCAQALQINGVSPVLYAEAFAHHFAQANRGTLALIGSVAGDRGRRSNYVYGAAKGMVDRYLQGLQHRFAGSGVRVVLIKPGPTDTPMTAHLKISGARLAPVENVARQIVEGIDRGSAVIYTPGKWRLIMLVIRHLPAFIFNKLNI